MYDYPNWRVTAGVILLATLSPDLEASPGFTRVTPSRIQEESVLTRDELANMSYEGVYDEPFRLTDGVYAGEPFVRVAPLPGTGISLSLEPNSGNLFALLRDRQGDSAIVEIERRWLRDPCGAGTSPDG